MALAILELSGKISYVKDSKLKVQS